MKKIIILVLTIILPCFLLLEIWAGFIYDKNKKEITRLSQEQVEWIDKNKKVLLNITAFSSPDRVRFIAENKLGLVPLDKNRKTEVTIQTGDSTQAN